jgi:hypothetical protein
MAKRNRFSIRNELPKSLTLNIEPEGALFPLACGDEVVVSEEFREIPLTVKFSESAKGETVISIWPGDGDVQVAKDGEDVFDLIQKEVNV